LMTDVARDAAERGHLATDQYGHALVEFDRAAESRLRLKIDLYIVPTVALMYLFCFIDRANIGVSHLPHRHSPCEAFSCLLALRLRKRKIGRFQQRPRLGRLRL
jgi:hypothetical protein